MLQSIYEAILDSLFPKVCLRCGAYGSYLCEICQEQIPRNIKQRCIICQKPSLGGWTHPKCSSKTTPNRLITIFDYHTFPIARVITQGKYYFIPEIFEILGYITATELLLPPLSVLIPIPLANRRKRWRGFNQSEVVASTIAKTISLQLVTSLIRIKHTATQKGLNQTQRKQNLLNVFSLPQALQSELVILIDDVTTTGSTFIETTKACKQNFSGPVWCIAIAQD